MAACSPATVANETNASSVSFQGAQRVVPLPDGKWRVEWTPVTAVAELEYLVYQRNENRAGYDFDNPVSRIPEGYFVTDDLRRMDSQCYIVRALIKGAPPDQNRTEVCTGHKAFDFRGIKSLKPLEKGNYLISWERGAYSNREMSFELRERARGQKTWTVAGTTSENFLASRVITIGEVICFNVRYIHPTLPKDLNGAEICTDEENTGNFTGIKSIEKFPFEKGTYDINWEPSIREDIIGYRIFKGIAMEEVVAEVPASAKSYRVRGLGVGASFSFGVRLVTRSGREDGNTRTLQVAVENEKPVVNSVSIETLGRVNSAGVTVKDVLECKATVSDPDRSNEHIFPKIEFKAQVTLGERPILLRTKVVAGAIKLNAEGKAEMTARYTLDPSRDRRGSDLYCEVTAFDGLDISDPKKSDYIVLPDTPPVATGMFISKRARYDQSMGTTHYYDSTLGGEPGQVLNRIVQGQMVAENHRCMIAGSEGAIQNKDSQDICEDTSVSIVLKKSALPTRLLEPGKEAELQAYRNRIAYQNGQLGTDYTAFFADPLNLAKTGYFDPDDSDLASRIETRNAKNSQVVLARCLEGVCTINLTLKKDYNSGSDLGDKKTDGTPYPHAQVEYRVRTYEPADDKNCSTLDGSSCSTVGWSNWAPLMIEVTAVDEEPRNTGITVSGTEDIVQKIVLCNQLRSDPTTAQTTPDPECSLDKTISLNPLFDPTTQDPSFKYLPGEGYGYFDLEDDPLVRVLPDQQIDPAIGEWVVPAVPNPDLTNRTHWTPLGNVPLTAADAANCDQTAIDAGTGQPVFCPFHCERETSKCYAYFMPALDVYSRQTLAYNSWVEVDAQNNPDPSFAGLVGKDREVRSKTAGQLYLDIAPTNDMAEVPSVLNSSWTEDQEDGIQHQLKFRHSLTPLMSTLATADFIPYYDPDIERLPDGSLDRTRTDMLRRAIDFEVRFLENGVYKHSFCESPSLLHFVTNDYPGTLLSDPATCQFDLGNVYYYPLPPDANAGKLTAFRAKMTLRCTATGAEPNGRCDGDVIYPPNYNGRCTATDAALPENADKCVPNHRFEFRFQTTRLDAQGNYIVDAARDWTPWKQADLTTIPVSDAPRTFTVSMGGLDSRKADIKEDVPFTVTMSKGPGIGAVNLTIIQGGVPIDVRYYQGYFDVDETEDVATKVVMTSVSEFEAGSPALLDSNGNALRGDDGQLLNQSATGLSTAFVCDDEGTCSADFRSAQNFFVPIGQPDPSFQFLVETRPKRPEDRDPLPVGQELLPARLQTSSALSKGRMSFNISPVDDAPGTIGSGGLALPEDTPTFFVVRKGTAGPAGAGGSGGIGYSEIEGEDVAEKIEFGYISFLDPVPSATLSDADGPNGFGYPDGLANDSGSTGPLVPAPAAIDRSASGPLANRLMIRGETFVGASVVKVADADVDLYKLPEDVGAGLPERWQFSCRRAPDVGLAVGDCWFEIRSPLHFNTGTKSGTPPRTDSLRKAAFSYRIFTRNPTLFNDSNEIGGAWSSWTPIEVGFDPVNDAPSWNGSFNLATMTRNNGGGPSDDNQTGTLSSTNPWRLEEGKEEYLEFRWREHYLDPDYSTESFTYKKDFPLDINPPFYPSEMLRSSSFLASKLAVFFPTVNPVTDPPVATTAFYTGASLGLAPNAQGIRCPWGRRYGIGLVQPVQCNIIPEFETIDDPGATFSTRSFLPSAVRAVSLPTAGSTYTFVHLMNAPAGAFGSWSVYDYSKPTPKLSDTLRDQYFEIASSTNSSIVFRRKLASDATVGANVTIELALPTQTVTASGTLSTVGDVFLLSHGRNQNFAGSNSWRVYDQNLGRYLTTAERDLVLTAAPTSYDAIRFSRTAGGYGPNFQFEVDFSNSWFPSANAEFYGVPAPDGTATIRSNINCDSNGNCRYTVIPPAKFFGDLRTQVRIADGNSLPSQTDWSLDSQKRDIFIRVDNVDDLPVIGGNDLVVDIWEDYPYDFMFVPKSNAPFNPLDLTYGPTLSTPSTIPELTTGCAGGGQCVGNTHIIAPYFDTKAPQPWVFPQNYIKKVKGGLCFGMGSSGCGRFKHAFLFATVADEDREGPTHIAFDTLAPTDRISISDPSNDPGSVTIPPSYFPDGPNKALRNSPFVYSTVGYGTHAFFTLESASNYFNARYRNQPSGRPFDYIMGPRGAGSTPWANPANVDPDGKGDLYFDYRIKTSDLGLNLTNTVDCSDPANCWSNQGRFYVRIHPVDDVAQANNVIATTVPSQADGVTPVALNVTKIVTSKEDDIITLEINPADYLDPDANSLTGEGKAIGIGQCIDTELELLSATEANVGDFAFFNWSPMRSYLVAVEDVFLGGARSDPLAGPDSMLRFDDIRWSVGGPPGPVTILPNNVSRGFVSVTGGVANSTTTLQGGSGASSRSVADAALDSTCDFNISGDRATPTGTCRMKLRPLPNLAGDFGVCVQVSTLPQLGDYINPTQVYSERIWVKIRIQDVDDPPHIGQLAVRARGNEDHRLEVEAVPRSFQWTRAGALTGAREGASVIAPGYWDFDSSATLIDETGLSGAALTDAQTHNANVRDNFAEYMYVNMAPFGTEFTGIGAGSILYRSNPALSRTDIANFDQTCQSGGGGFDGSDICRIPCEGDGRCYFLFNPPADEPKAGGSTGRFTAQWWISQKGRLRLSSRPEDNQWAARTAVPAGLPGVRLGATAGSVQEDYDRSAAAVNYDFTNSLACLSPVAYDLFGWRAAFLEEGEPGGIPGLFGQQAFSPISTPSYTRPGTQAPDVNRIIPDTSVRNGTDVIHLYDYGNQPKPEHLLIDRRGDRCSGSTVIDGKKVCGSWTNPSIVPHPTGYLDFRDGNRPAGSISCPGGETGRLAMFVEPVADKPEAKAVVRTVSGNNSTLLKFSQLLTADQDGYRDRDGDKPQRMSFLSPGQLVVGGVTAGTFSLSSTPPGTVQGFDQFPVVDGFPAIPQETSISAPGCSVSEGDCSVWFHPNPGFNGTVNLDFTITTVGADGYAWESDRTGPDGPGRLTLNIRSSSPKITIFGAEPGEILEDSVSAPVRVTGGGSNLSMIIDEDQVGSSIEDRDQVVVTFESSNILVIDPAKVTFSCTDGAPGVATNFGGCSGTLNITPELNAITTVTPVTLTIRTAKTGTSLVTTRTLDVHVVPIGDVPSIGTEPKSVNSPTNDYVTNEDTPLVINGVVVDEGGGPDENVEVVSMSWSSSQPSIIPVAGISMDLSDEATPGNNAGGTPRSITITPAANQTTTGVTLTMTVSDGVSANTTRSFKVIVQPVNDPPLITSGNPSLAGPYAVKQGELTAIGALGGLKFDEGGELTGAGSEDNQAVIWSFLSSDPSVINPATDVAISGAPDGVGDSNAIARTLTVTPSGYGTNVTVTLRISDDAGSTWVSYPFTVDVRQAPGGTVSCTSGTGVGGNEFVRAINQPVTGISCSGVTAPGTTTNAYAWEIAAVPETTCSGITIHGTTGVLSGTMPIADCDVVVSANDTASGADKTYLPASKRKTLKLLASSVTSLSFGTTATLAPTCSLSVPVTASYYLNRTSLASAAPVSVGSVFNGMVASDTSWTGQLSDFGATTETLELTVTDTAGNQKNAQTNVTMATAPFPFLALPAPTASVDAATSEGLQPGFDFSKACADSTCATAPRAVLAAGSEHSCVVTAAASQELYCYGNNAGAQGRLGLGNTTDGVIGLPASTGLANVTAVSIGRGHTCAIIGSGASATLKCFGDGTQGQLGLAAGSENPAPSPTTALLPQMGAPLQDVAPAAVAAGRDHTCYLGQGTDATLGGGKVFCTGSNSLGQLGYDTTADSDTSSGFDNRSGIFQAVTGLDGVLAIASGDNHSCALSGTAGSRVIKCWGSNSKHQLGELNRALNAHAFAPITVTVTDTSLAIALAAGGDTTCALLSTGAVRCWGDGAAGQLGDNTTVSTSGTATKPAVTPVGLDGLTPGGSPRKVVALSMGSAHTCALTSSRELWCFGSNSTGQLGLGSSPQALTPTQVTVAGGVVGVSAGDEHSCLVTATGTIACMGRGDLGALGYISNAVPPIAGRTTPETVPGHSARRQQCLQTTVTVGP